MTRSRQTRQSKNADWWANRITAYGEKPAREFVAHEKNARRHPEKQRDALRGSLSSVGWVAPVIVSARSRKILDGHARIEEALSRDPDQLVPFVEVDVTAKEERLILAIFDPIGGLATYDQELLGSLLEEVSTGDAGINQLLTDLATDNGLSLVDGQAAGAGGDEFDTTPDPAQTRVQSGDLWQLREHQVLCGDSTNPEEVARIIGGNQPFMMVTDPPYGVGYDPTWRDEAGGQFGDGLTKMRGKVSNDDQVDWSAAYDLFPGDVAYVWHAGIYAGDVSAHLRSSQFEIRAQIIWVKQHFVLSRGHYHWQHEPCWYAVRRGRKANWGGDRTLSTTWEIASMNPAGGNREEKTGHGTQKPIECMAKPIRNHGKPGDFIYDPFLGSGSTLIAADREGRICLGVEIEPAYCEMVLRRWEAETGGKPKLLKRTNGQKNNKNNTYKKGQRHQAG